MCLPNYLSLVEKGIKNLLPLKARSTGRQFRDWIPLPRSPGMDPQIIVRLLAMKFKGNKTFAKFYTKQSYF